MILSSLHLFLNYLIRLSTNLISRELTTSKIPNVRNAEDKILTNYASKFFFFCIGRGRQETEKKVKGRKDKKKRRKQKKKRWRQNSGRQTRKF